MANQQRTKKMFFKHAFAFVLIIAASDAAGYSEERAVVVPNQSAHESAMHVRRFDIHAAELLDPVVPRNLKGSGSKSSKGSKAKQSKGPKSSKKAKKTKSPGRNSMAMAMAVEPAGMMPVPMAPAMKAMATAMARKHKKGMRALESDIDEYLGLVAISDSLDGLPMRDLKGSGSKSSKGSKAKTSKGPKSSKKAKKTKSPGRNSMAMAMAMADMEPAAGMMPMTPAMKAMATAMTRKHKQGMRALESDIDEDLDLVAINAAVSEALDGLPVRNLKGSGSKSSKGSKAKNSKGPKSSKKAKKTKSPGRNSVAMAMAMATEPAGMMPVPMAPAMKAMAAMKAMRKRRGRALESDRQLDFLNDVVFVENEGESSERLTEADIMSDHVDASV